MALRAHPIVRTRGDVIGVREATIDVRGRRAASARASANDRDFALSARAKASATEWHAAFVNANAREDAERDRPGVCVVERETRVVYVGCGKLARADAYNAIASNAQGEDVNGFEVKVMYLPTNARRGAIAAAWKQTAEALGYVPEWNARERAAKAREETTSDRSARRFEFTEAQFNALKRDGIVVIDDWFGDDARACARAARTLFERGTPTRLGQIGRDDDVVVLATAAMPTGEAYSALGRCAKALLDVPAALRRARAAYGSTSGDDAFAAKCARAAAPERLMLARYPPNGGRYVAHLDNDPSDPAHEDGVPGLRACDRTFTCIAYLNPDWIAEHGGYFRAYRGAEVNDDFVEIAPTLGRVVVFDSSAILHEVRPSFANRFAMTVWT